MNRQEAIASITDVANRLDKIGEFNTATSLMVAMETLIKRPQPDPDTGLVPCGCGGAAVDNVGIDYRYGYKCQKCGIETMAGPNRDCAKEVWNTAMGWKGGNGTVEQGKGTGGHL